MTCNIFFDFYTFIGKEIVESAKRAQRSRHQGASMQSHLYAQDFLEDENCSSIEHQMYGPDKWRGGSEGILKWMDAVIIFPISDNKWVDPIQCVSKKRGTTVITNEK